MVWMVPLYHEFFPILHGTHCCEPDAMFAVSLTEPVICCIIFMHMSPGNKGRFRKSIPYLFVTRGSPAAFQPSMSPATCTILLKPSPVMMSMAPAVRLPVLQ